MSSSDEILKQAGNTRQTVDEHPAKENDQGLLPLAPEERCAVFPAAFSMMEKVALLPHCMYKYTIKGSEQ